MPPSNAVNLYNTMWGNRAQEGYNNYRTALGLANQDVSRIGANEAQGLFDWRARGYVGAPQRSDVMPSPPWTSDVMPVRPMVTAPVRPAAPPVSRPNPVGPSNAVNLYNTMWGSQAQQGYDNYRTALGLGSQNVSGIGANEAQGLLDWRAAGYRGLPSRSDVMPGPPWTSDVMPIPRRR